MEHNGSSTRALVCVHGLVLLMHPLSFYREKQVSEVRVFLSRGVETAALNSNTFQ
jgi:hypothetical protein